MEHKPSIVLPSMKEVLDVPSNVPDSVTVSEDI